MKLLIGTHNRGKAEEMSRCLNPFKLDWVCAGDIPGLLAPDEDGTSYRENARMKARFYASFSGLPCIAEDSGLEVAALQGRPGLLSARYAGASSPDCDKICSLLHELSGVAPDRREARYVCVAVLNVPGWGEWTARGECRGRLLESPTGGGGFGYDPVFLVPSLGRSMAQLSVEEKCRISHRGEALMRLAWPISRLGALEGWQRR